MLEAPTSYWLTFKAPFHMSLLHVKPTLLLTPQTICSRQALLLATSHPTENRLHLLCSHHPSAIPRPPSLPNPTSVEPSYLNPTSGELAGMQFCAVPYGYSSMSAEDFLCYLC